MGNIFTLLYSVFSDMFGTPLFTCLSGQTSAAGGNRFVIYGLTMLFVSLLFAAFFYYLLGSPRFAKRWFWTTCMITNAVANFLIGWLGTLSGLRNGLMAIIDPETGASITQVTSINCLFYGMANAIWAAVFFAFWSVAIKWWSPMACRTPF